MTIESQVTNLELSKRLAELGVTQESYFHWHHYLIGDWIVVDGDDCPIRSLTEQKNYSAYTVAEHLEATPHRITLPSGEPYNSFRLRIEKGIWCVGESANTNNPKYTEFYSVNYYCDTTSQTADWLFASLTKNMPDENPANALAKMRIYLLENKLI